MIIRKATLQDADAVASLLLLAMEDIVYWFIGIKDNAKAKAFMLHFVKRKANQYTYENCWVVTQDNNIIAAVNVYDGAMLQELREPVTQYLKTQFGNNLNVADETEPGEYYIDSLGVSPNRQGGGIGSKLLRFLIDEYVNKNHQTLGLLVDEENPNAKSLYMKLGFLPVGKKTLAGKNMEHLQIKSSDGV